MASRIFWAGDSTVKENTITSFPQTGIGQVFRLYLKRNILVYDFAENGRSTKSFIEEGRLDMIDKKISEGDFLFIQFGFDFQNLSLGSIVLEESFVCFFQSTALSDLIALRSFSSCP